MKIDYKKELEAASKGMIMIHDPQTLIKLILRMIVRKVDIKHAGVILHDPLQDSYVLNISRGEAGMKVPAGFARFSRSSPLIRFLLENNGKEYGISRGALLADDLNRLLWQENVLPGNNGAKEFFHQIHEQLQMVNAVACVPAYYHRELIAVLLLGEKNNGKKFSQDEIDFFAALTHDVAMALRNAQLFAEAKKESEKNRQLLVQVTTALSSTIEAKDTYTGGHTESVADHCLAIARRMAANGSADLQEDFFKDLQMASLLHDIGKIGIPESILRKPGALTEEEFALMKKHTLIGAEILKPVEEFVECAKGVKYHHERYDGKGYPEGLKGDDIPMIAAILTVADSYDAMISDRPYRKGLPKAHAIEEIKKNCGSQFHPLPVRAIVELYEEGII
jgi:putative nucleotidyltransferase with HDIG domain